MTIRIKSVSIEAMLIWLAIGITLVGFIIAIIGAFLNGLDMFNGQRDLSKGFGLILIGDSIALLGAIIVVLVLVLYIFRLYCEDIIDVDMKS